MKRNSTTLFLTSPNSTTPLPWVDNAPDFSGFSNPTLAVLQKSWQNFVDSGQELEVIPDPTPPAPEPDWDGFLAPFLSPGEGNIYDSIATPVQQSTAKTQEHWANIRSGLINPAIRNPQWLYGSWEYLKALLTTDGNGLSVEAIAAVEALMNQYNLLP